MPGDTTPGLHGGECIRNSGDYQWKIFTGVCGTAPYMLGIPESVGEKEATKKGYRIPSEGLALMLKNYFNTCEKQASLKEYLREVIEQTGATPEHLAREFHVDEKDLKERLQ